MEEAEGWSLGKWCSVLLARSSASIWLKDFIFFSVSALKMFCPPSGWDPIPRSAEYPVFLEEAKDV